jgi:hypothetical protein
LVEDTRALSYGMPPAGGVGVGVDRLVLFTNSQTVPMCFVSAIAAGKAGAEDPADVGIAQRWQRHGGFDRAYFG